MLPAALAQALLERINQAGHRERWQANPIEWTRERRNAFVWSIQGEILDSVRDNPRTAVKSCHGIGKALPLDTPIATPSGWTTMGALRVGDRVLDERGLPCNVVGKTQVWDLDCYRVTFDDGAQQVCTGEHEWNVIDLRHRPRNIADWRDHWAATVTLDTRTIAANVEYHGQKRFRVPTARALDLPEAQLPIDPYTFGIWLGDGTACRSEITCHPSDREVMDRIAESGENVVFEGGCQWNLTGKLADRDRFHTRLRALGVLNNKHIPDLYIRASAAQRLEVLRGLMDSDGFNAAHGVGMDLCNETLAADVVELVTSLGWKITTRTGAATCNGRPAGTRWRMMFYPDVPVFHLARKREAQALRGGQRSRQTQRTIVSVEPTDRVPTVCIEVDSPRHLYLAGRSLVPTHNSWTAADVALWWIDAHEPGEAIVVSTAPTYQQVHAILWEEIRKGHRAASLDGVVLKSDEWQSANGDIVGFGRKPADTDEHGFQGIHRRYVMVIIDEACGVPKQLFTAAEAIATNADCRILAIGNPDDPNTEFGAVCKPGSGYNVITVSAFDTPNFTGEEIPDRLSHLLVSPEWVDDKRRRWGESSPLWHSKVLGKFPDVGENTLIPPAWVSAAQNRSLEPSGPNTLGVDVARFGPDTTVIGHRQGAHFRIVKTLPYSATTTTTGEVIAYQREHGHPVAQVDGVGVGSGVVDQLREQGRPVSDMQAGAAATPEIDPETGKPVTRFLNARAQWYWGLRKLFELGAVDIDPNDDELASQLSSMRYGLDSKGRIKIESKDDMKDRGLPSPDRADAMMLAYGEQPEALHNYVMGF